jgi:hypothetical protein
MAKQTNDGMISSRMVETVNRVIESISEIETSCESLSHRLEKVEEGGFGGKEVLTIDEAGFFLGILRLAGLPDDENCENLTFFGLREFTPGVRLSLIEYALHRDKGYGLVIIDGIRDLMLDINNPSESVNLINKLMQWSSQYNLHIHCVLHLNKGDDNVLGHIGTELSNKAETVLVISKSRVDASVSEVRPLNIRDREFKPFAFKVNDDGLPENVSDYSIDRSMLKKNRMMASDLTDDQHREALSIAFEGGMVSGYENILEALSKGYTSIGFVRGRTILSKMLSTLLDKGFIIKQGQNDYLLSEELEEAE